MTLFTTCEVFGQSSTTSTAPGDPGDHFNIQVYWTPMGLAGEGGVTDKNNRSNGAILLGMIQYRTGSTDAGVRLRL